MADSEKPPLTKKIKNIIDTNAKQLSNDDLLDATLTLAQGDYYDGGFTPIGEYRYGVLEDELKRRLYGWLNSARKTTSVDNSTDKG